jgi:hypothetical protein
MQEYNTYLKRKKELQQAIVWNDKPNSKNRYQHDAFEISEAHCQIKLVRVGQHSVGGTNYWETEREFNTALLKVILSDSSIIDKALSVMEDRKREALMKCKGIAEQIEAEITEMEG